MVRTIAGAFCFPSLLPFTFFTFLLFTFYLLIFYPITDLQHANVTKVRTKVCNCIQKVSVTIVHTKVYTQNVKGK